MGQHLGRGVGPTRSGGRQEKKMKRRRVPGGLGRRQVEEEVGRNWAGEMDRSATGQVRWVREVEKERKN